MKDKILFFGRNKNYNITHLCFNELLEFVKNTEHEVVMTVVSDDSHGSQDTLETLATKAGTPWMSVPNNDVNTDEFISKLKELKPTISITVQFPKIFKANLINVPERAFLNIHRGWPYRGGSIDERAIYTELSTYNVILHHITMGIDTGNIIGKVEVQISNSEDGYSLVDKADLAGKKLFIEYFLPLLGNPIPVGEKQVIEETVYGSKGDLSNIIDLSKSSIEIERLCRAFYHPRKAGACLKIKGENFYIFPPIEIITGKSSEEPGTILFLEKDRVILKTGDLKISITKCHKGDKNPILFGEQLLSMGFQVGDVI